MPTILLSVWLASPCAIAQTQGGSDDQTAEANQSWTATTQQQLPSNLNPTRTSETHTAVNGRIVDNQSIERMGMDGRYAPYQDVQKETIRVDANTVRTVERTFGRDSDGRKTLVQVTEEEKHILPGGEVQGGAHDIESRCQRRYADRAARDSGHQQINPSVQETKSTFLTASPNGGLAASSRPRNARPRQAIIRLSFASPLYCLIPTATGSSAKSEKALLRRMAKIALKKSGCCNREPTAIFP